MRRTILLIDDDERLIELLTRYLTQNDFNVLSATDPNQGLEILRHKKPDLMILDVMMPGKNGLDVCKEVRQTSSIPLIMLTARGDVMDRILGLEFGADDYLSKPFEARELLARIQSVLRRTTASPRIGAIIRLGPLTIDMDARSAQLQGQALDLTTSEFETLTLFATHPGRVFSRDEIMEHLRGIDWQSYHRSADVLISRLRQKLGDDPKKPAFFKTIWGSGYMFLVQKEGAI